jgi:hypothetical protein
MVDYAKLEDRFPVRFERYRCGNTDQEIADAEGKPRNSITVWRKSHGLPANYSTLSHKLSPEENAARLFLYGLGWSDHRIAKEQGCAHGAVCQWRNKRSLPANFRSGQRESFAPSPGVEITWKRVRDAVGRLLPADIADDAAAELMLDLLEGRLEDSQIAKQAKSYGNRMLSSFANKFGARSLDEILPGTEDFRLIDTLRDDNSRDWLEKMGATVW